MKADHIFKSSAKDPTRLIFDRKEFTGERGFVIKRRWIWICGYAVRGETVTFQPFLDECGIGGVYLLDESRKPEIEFSFVKCGGRCAIQTVWQDYW